MKKLKQFKNSLIEKRTWFGYRDFLTHIVLTVFSCNMWKSLVVKTPGQLYSLAIPKSGVVK